jgi:hypothetical protein
MGLKVDNNIFFFFTMLTKQNLIKILHSEFVKKKVFVGYAEWSTHLGIPKTLPLKKKGLIIMSCLPFFKIKKLIYFHGQHAPFEIQRWISASLRASLKLVYFYRRLAHFKIKKGIFSWTTYLSSNSKKNFSKPPCFPKICLFSWATCPFWNLKN